MDRPLRIAAGDHHGQRHDETRRRKPLITSPIERPRRGIASGGRQRSGLACRLAVGSSNRSRDVMFDRKEPPDQRGNTPGKPSGPNEVDRIGIVEQHRTTEGVGRAGDPRGHERAGARRGSRASLVSGKHGRGGAAGADRRQRKMQSQKSVVGHSEWQREPE